MFLFYYLVFVMFFFFKQKTAYEMRISDWSSDVCSSDLPDQGVRPTYCKGDGARSWTVDDFCCSNPHSLPGDVPRSARSIACGARLDGRQMVLRSHSDPGLCSR